MRGLLIAALSGVMLVGSLLFADTAISGRDPLAFFADGFEEIACLPGNDCSFLDTTPVCDSAPTCQGSQRKGVCQGSTCRVETVDSDVGCDSDLKSQNCGNFLPVNCTGADEQLLNQASLCGTSCASANDCDSNAHCSILQQCELNKIDGNSCSSDNQCESNNCIDGICCNSQCNGTCEACNVAGFEGACTAIPSGQDPEAECGALSCSGYYSGFSGDMCYRKSDVTAQTASCDGAGTCQAPGILCPLQAQGSIATTCDSECQDPMAGTCQGTTAGICTDVNPGQQTCGFSACEVTVEQCLNGSANVCTPQWANATIESCNGIDDNCDGSVDNRLPGDSYEPNNSCSAAIVLPSIGSLDPPNVVDNLTLYDSGDADYYLIRARETDNVCQNCDGRFISEEYNFQISLDVPNGAGSYELCANTDCAKVHGNCTTVSAGQSGGVSLILEGSCSASEDNYNIYVRVTGISDPGYSCQNYQLGYRFVAGCF